MLRAGSDENVCVCVCVCVCPPIRTYKDQNVFTHLRYEDHRSYEDRYLVLVNFKAPNGLKRWETCFWTVLTVVPVNHLKVCVKWWSF